MPDTCRRRLACLLLLLATNGCVTTTMIAQPSFWDSCGAKENCGPVVAGVLGAEMLVYGVVAGVAAGTTASRRAKERARAEGADGDAAAPLKASHGPLEKNSAPEPAPSVAPRSKTKRWPSWP